VLKNASPTLAGGYSFVNPAVAVLVGVWLGNEQLTGWVFAALPLIGMALALLLYGPQIGGIWSRFYDVVHTTWCNQHPPSTPEKT